MRHAWSYIHFSTQHPRSSVKLCELHTLQHVPDTGDLSRLYTAAHSAEENKHDQSRAQERVA